ncbi:MAG: sulfite exporter TauE/SafE family protein [Actinomycetota bacterium]|nr:sulfite exporter TauE/SafE family protein [Actinomycetota bacterium]
MTFGDLGLLFVAGVGAGIVGSTAGLASLISYPALLLTGLPPVVANVTNTVGLIGSSAGSVLGSRREFSGRWRSLSRSLPLAAAGGLLGAILLLIGPPGSFERIVPFLVAFASTLLLLSPQIRAAAARRAARRRVGSPSQSWILPVLFPCFVYGGYFGAAAGMIILAALLIGTEHSLPVANAMKNLMLGVANMVAAITFAFSTSVSWLSVPPLLLGCVLGGWLGPGIVRRINPAVLRWIIGIAGLALAVRLWFN